MSTKDYIDGVPFILSKKFYPLPNYQLPHFELHIPQEALLDDYDFAFENNIIASFNEYFTQKKREESLRLEKEIRLKKEAEEAQLQNLALEALRIEEAQRVQKTVENEKSEALNKFAENDEGNAGSRASNLPPTAVINLNPIPTQTETQPQLIPSTTSHLITPNTSYVNFYPENLPMHYTQKNYSTSSTCTSAKSTVSNRTNQLNLADFETHPASPFDSVALTSLDDRSELEKVWASSINNYNVSPNPIPTPTPQPYYYSQFINSSTIRAESLTNSNFSTPNISSNYNSHQSIAPGPSRPHPHQMYYYGESVPLPYPLPLPNGINNSGVPSSSTQPIYPPPNNLIEQQETGGRLQTSNSVQFPFLSRFSRREPGGGEEQRSSYYYKLN